MCYRECILVADEGHWVRATKDFDWSLAQSCRRSAIDVGHVQVVS
jgi:hypothetical protein